MNAIQNCTVEYITASRTIETVRFVNNDKVFYIYNYEGNHFRVFIDLLSFIQFFQLGIEPQHTFLSEDELDEFLVSFRFT